MRFDVLLSATAEKGPSHGPNAFVPPCYVTQVMVELSLAVKYATYSDYEPWITLYNLASEPMATSD